MVYRPKTRVQVRLNLQKYREISTLTGIPLSQTMKYGDQILNKSMADTIQDIERNIAKYVPKATGQLQDSLTKQLHHSNLRNNWLQMKLGTYVQYMKYVANMNSRMTRHPKYVAQKYNTYQRNSKHGKKGSKKRNPGKWRYVHYYGAPRWVMLDDPKAQTNFFSQLVVHMKTQLQKHIAGAIRTQFPAGQRKPWTDKFKVK